MSIEFIAPDAAYEAACERLKNKKLQTRVAQYLGDLWPAGFEKTDAPRAVFAPYLAKASVTETTFICDAKITGFRPVVATYLQSEYVTANPGLVDCYRAPLIWSQGRQTRDWVVLENERSGAVGKANTEYDTLNIVEYWSGIRNIVLAEQNLSGISEVRDFSEWYTSQAQRFGWSGERSKSPFYYRALMGLYTSGRAVLYDTPPTDFAKRVMEPASEVSSAALGYEPLITCEYQPGKRDWTDVSFLGDADCQKLQEQGRI